MNKNNQNNLEAPMNENMPTVLIIEDDVALNRLISITLEREGFKTVHALNGAEAISVAQAARDAIILLDYCLPDMDGKQIILALREAKNETPIIMMTGHGDERIAVEIMKLGARDYIIKEPDFISKLPKIIRQTLEVIATEKALELVEKAYWKSETKYRELYENMMDAFVKIDMKGRITEFNQVYCDMLGYSAQEMRGLTHFDVTPAKWLPDENAVVETQVLPRGYSNVYEKEYRRKDGSVFPVELRTVLIKDNTGNPAGMWAIIRDISERKQAMDKQKNLEEQLRQSQKLEAIGQLSSGVAHDFNNILGGIMGHAELLERGLDPASPLLGHSEIIVSLCQKAADLTKQLLSFARKAPFELQKIDMNSFVKQTAGLLERTIDRSIEIIVDVPAQHAFISGDLNQLENALLNIAINARDAMPKGGSIRLTTEITDLNKTVFAAEGVEVIEGPYVKVSMADTGSGMSKEIKDRIFEPFFTTKEVGKGTGLGLASVYGCVKQHNGYIAVDSREGTGTRFDLYFPIADSGWKQKAQQKDKLIPGKSSLLIVDDEQVFHDILHKIFTPIGYTVHGCLGGAEAVEYYRVNSADIDIVILDMNMPKMSGEQCFRLLKKINPNVRVIIATGYGDNSKRKVLQKEGVRAFIQKPYKAAELSAKIAELTGSRK
jgi:PAS domain S-box-containing protein